VRADKVVQIDRRAKVIRDAKGVRTKFGIPPELIPDYLALVGDSADGYPGIPGIGKIGAAKLLNQHGPIELFPEKLLTGQRERGLLFKRLATLRTEAALFRDVDELRWRGPTVTFTGIAARLGEPRLLARANTLAAKIVTSGQDQDSLAGSHLF
jgi:5'-3' exonuclease